MNQVLASLHILLPPREKLSLRVEETVGGRTCQARRGALRRLGLEAPLPGAKVQTASMNYSAARGLVSKKKMT